MHSSQTLRRHEEETCCTKLYPKQTGPIAGMILTVILSSLRYARIRVGVQGACPEQTRSVGGVPA
jgi:hypothetical protein